MAKIDSSRSPDLAANGRALQEPPFSQLFGEAIKDLLSGLGTWRIWWHLGMNDIRMRYQRSAIGQNWQTLSVGVFIACLTTVYSVLFNVGWRDYLTYVVCSYSSWLLLSGLLSDASGVYISSASMFRHYRIPKSTSLYQSVVRNMAIFAHNVVLIVPAFIIAGHFIDWTFLLVIPALILYAINAVWLGIVLGALSARFRDVSQAVQSVVQILFITTPVMYMPSTIPGEKAAFLDYNPFAHFLAILRDPMLGQVPTALHYQVVLAITLSGVLLGLYTFAVTRRKLIYWL